MYKYIGLFVLFIGITVPGYVSARELARFPVTVELVSQQNTTNGASLAGGGGFCDPSTPSFIRETTGARIGTFVLFYDDATRTATFTIFEEDGELRLDSSSNVNSSLFTDIDTSARALRRPLSVDDDGLFMRLSYSGQDTDVRGDSSFFQTESLTGTFNNLLFRQGSPQFTGLLSQSFSISEFVTRVDTQCEFVYALSGLVTPPFEVGEPSIQSRVIREVRRILMENGTMTVDEVNSKNVKRRTIDIGGIGIRG